jgi:hypothetical protein
VSVSGKNLTFYSGPTFMSHGPISFPGWKPELARAGLEPVKLHAFEREIIGFLCHCKARHSPVTAELARQYLVLREKQTTGPAREALRWFYRMGRRGAVPPAAGGRTEAPAAASVAPRSADSPMGHASVETTQIYLHVMKKPRLGVRSPFDTLRAALPGAAGLAPGPFGNL